MELNEEHFSSYKEYHEYFMMNHNGTSLLESAFAITPQPSTLLLWSTVLPSILMKFPKKEASVQVFMLEFLIIVLPLALCYTVLSDCIHVVSSALIIVFITSMFLQNIKNTFHLNIFKEWYSMPSSSSHRPFISNFKAYMNVTTCICILAVDFRVFPRKFCKTEVSGYGLMDTGAGLFVVANGLVSYKSLGEKNSVSFKSALVSSTPLIILGFIRLLATQLVQYHEHVSEYGTQWNFFFTLSATRLLSSFVLSIVGSNYRRVFLTFILLGVLHEIVLTFFGLREWVISNDVARTSFIASNREGLISLPGYLCLHFGGTVIFGRICSRPRLRIAHWISCWMELFIATIFLWIFTHVLHESCGVSRRVADLGYIFWILAYSMSSLTCFLTVELISSVILHCKMLNTLKTSSEKLKPNQDTDSYAVPVIFKAVNYNGLLYFLLSNLLTGMINLSLKPLTIEKWPSVLIILFYALTSCAILHIFYVKKIKIKIW